MTFQNSCLGVCIRVRRDGIKTAFEVNLACTNQQLIVTLVQRHLHDSAFLLRDTGTGNFKRECWICLFQVLGNVCENFAAGMFCLPFHQTSLAHF